ncbi:MAG: adenylyl-sulfate kinase [Candidatus Omnitrophota bacterium]|nr:MAG: adenylyl-sulfate kinase [Candidatus Omnitrophota bacterium]
MEQRGLTIWFTGLPGSGKSTIANLVAERLKAGNYKVERLDGDIVRKSLTRDLGFSKEDRDKNIQRVTFVAKLLTRNGVFVLSSFVSPYRAARENARREIGSFFEVYVKCSLQECMRRDVKGMYKKAMAGEIKDFTGVSDPYEEPQEPELVLETDKETPGENAEKVLSSLEGLGYLKRYLNKESKPEEGDSIYIQEEKRQVVEKLKSLGYLLDRAEATIKEL